MKKFNQYKNKQDKKQVEMLNNIYDILFNTGFKDEARKEFTKWYRGKEVEISYTEDTTHFIRIGKNFVLYLQNK